MQNISLIDSVNLLTAEEIEGEAVTAEIVRRYRGNKRFAELTAAALAETINADFIAAIGDGLPPFWECSAGLELPAGEKAEVKDSDRCQECHKPEWDCECDATEQAELAKEYHELIKRQFERELEAKEEGSFTASMVLDRAHLTFRQVAEETSRTANVPETFAIAGLLFTISSGAGKGLFVEFRKGQKTSLGINLLGFDISGGGKSECLKVTCDPVIRKNRELAKNWAEDLAETEAYIEQAQARISFFASKMKKGQKLTPDEKSTFIELKKELKKFQGVAKSAPAIWTEDTTLEGARNLLALNREQLSFFSDDAGKPLQNLLGAYNKLQMPEDHLYLKMYSVSDYRSDRAGQPPIFLPEVWGNMFWTTQPDKLELLTKNVWLRAGGFLARCLIARYGLRPRVLSDEAISPAILDDYSAEWNKVYCAYRFAFAETGESKTITPSPAAVELMKKWEKHIVDQMNGELYDFTAFAARYRENTIRLSGILHVMRHLNRAHLEPLNVQEVERAIVIMRFYIKQQKALLNHSRESTIENDRNNLADLLKRYGGSITTGKLKDNGNDVESMLACARGCPKRFRVEETVNEKNHKKVVTISLVQQPAQPNPDLTKTAEMVVDFRL